DRNRRWPPWPDPRAAPVPWDRAAGWPADHSRRGRRGGRCAGRARALPQRSGRLAEPTEAHAFGSFDTPPCHPTVKRPLTSHRSCGPANAIDLPAGTRARQYNRHHFHRGTRLSTVSIDVMAPPSSASGADARLAELRLWVRAGLGGEADELVPVSGDASFRRYFRHVRGDQSWIAMDAPPEYETCDEFVAIARHLHALGLNVPQVVAADLKRGFLLLTDLGS